MRSIEATKRAARAFFERNKNKPEFRAKRREWNRKWRHANPDFYVKPSYRFAILKAKCKHRNIQMSLTLEEYTQLTDAKPCHYCGCFSVSGGSGLDRVDNRYGYAVENCVACCYRCNVMKADLSLEEFYAQVERILDYRIRRGPGF